MLKRMLGVAIAILITLSQSAHANTGALFNLTTTGTPADVAIKLCLNGVGGLSCQNYTLAALSVTIAPTIANHVYPSIGIQILTPGYSIGNLGLDCTPSPNGYCLFSASQAQPKTMSLIVNAPLILSPTTLPTATTSSVYSQTITASGGISPYDYTISAGSPPPGLSLSTNGVLSGTATTVGTYSFTVAASDSNTPTSQTGSQVYTIHVLSGTTTTTLVSSVNPSTYNQSVTFTARVTPTGATGTVTFADGGTTIGTGALSGGVATFASSSLTSGTHSIVATYGGDSNFDGSMSTTVTQTVNQATQGTLTATASPSSIAYLSTSTLLTTGGSGTGAVTYTVSSGSSYCLISGATLTGTGVGTCTVIATKAADANYQAATSSPITVTVSPTVSSSVPIATLVPSITKTVLTSTTTMVYSSLNPSTTSSSVTLSAHVSSANGTPTGTVGFTSNGVGIRGCSAKTLTSGIATCTASSLETGTDAIVATYMASPAFATSTSASFSQTVVDTATETVPAFPQDITAVPGNGQVIVSWYPPVNTGGTPITGYTVKYGTTASTVFTNAGCTNTSNLSCTVSGLTNSTPYTFTVVAINDIGTGPTAFSSAVTPEPALTASPSNLALSGLGRGASRATTITNNSLSDVSIASVSIPSPSLPSGTSINTSQANACVTGMTLSANGGSCTITIEPGSSATSSCSKGIPPTASVITVTDNNGDTASTHVVVLDYGCQYQSGYLFSIDDTTPTTSSISGKVMSLSDQGISRKWSNDTIRILGIDDGSTISDPGLNASLGQTDTLAIGQLNCDAVNDGACATNNVFVHYGAGDYAVGLCKTPINSLTDWYLPSVCELGSFDFAGANTGNDPSLTGPLVSHKCTAGSTNIQNQLASTGVVNFTTINGYYWSSTEYSGDPQNNAWYQALAASGSGYPLNGTKNTPFYGVRCLRTLTL